MQEIKKSSRFAALGSLWPLEMPYIFEGTHVAIHRQSLGLPRGKAGCILDHGEIPHRCRSEWAQSTGIVVSYPRVLGSPDMGRPLLCNSKKISKPMTESTCGQTKCNLHYGLATKDLCDFEVAGQGAQVGVCRPLFGGNYRALDRGVVFSLGLDASPHLYS